VTLRRRTRTLLTWVDAWMASAATRFIGGWGKLESFYKLPLSWLVGRLRFAFYPLLAIAAIGWLGWDWNHDRSLDAAEDAVFDKVIKSRPFQPEASKRVVVVEIDDCTIEHFRQLGEGGWPLSRQRHADLLDALDRAGVRAVGYDVLFIDPNTQDPLGDGVLEAMAEGGEGRFIFGASRVDKAFDVSQGATPASQAPGAFALAPHPTRPGPKVALLLPYGEAMRKHSGLLDIDRAADGVIRDVSLRSTEGDWGIPSVALRLAAYDSGNPVASFPEKVRVNWRSHNRLRYVSAADLIEGTKVCMSGAMPSLKNKIALVGWTASGLNDIKPTPVGAATNGVEIQAEATAALVDHSAIWMPPTSLKYLLAALLVLLTAFAFFRGEPANDIDSIFVATNLLLLGLAYAGLTFYGVFFDIYASIGFVSLCFGLCRTWAAVQRGRAVGHEDFIPVFDAQHDRWLVLGRVRFVPYPSLDRKAAARRRREYRRRLRRFLYAGSNAVMLEGVVERKSWLHGTLDDLMLLVWRANDRNQALQLAEQDLDALYVHLNELDDRLDDDGTIKVCTISALVDDDLDDSDRGERLRLREALGKVLDAPEEWPLCPRNTLVNQSEISSGEPECEQPSAA
jgi:adenylate cyclase